MYQMSFLLHLSYILVVCSSTICSVSFSKESHTYDMCITRPIDVNNPNMANGHIIVDMCSNNTDFEPTLHLYDQDDLENDLCDDRDYCKYQTNNIHPDKLKCHRWNLTSTYLTNTCYLLSSDHDTTSDDQLTYSTLSIIHDCSYNISATSHSPTTTIGAPTFPSLEFDNNIDPMVALYFLIGAVCVSFIVGILMYLYGNLQEKAETDETCMDKIRFMKFISALVVLCCSTVSSLALSDTFDGLTKEENGLIAVIMSCIVIMVTVYQCQCNYTRHKIESDHPKTDAEQMTTLSRHFWIFVSVGATISDASFDFFQGIAFLDGQEFNDVTSFMVIFGTWIGVADETLVVLMETAVDQCCDKICDSLRKSRYTVMTLLVYFIMNLLTVIEASMCTYILMTFERRWYTSFGLMFQATVMALVLAPVLATCRAFYEVFKGLCNNYKATAIEDVDDPEI
eukprot:32464_1